jgi:uncharacterized RDD family membrane protein YckC
LIQAQDESTEAADELEEEPLEEPVTVQAPNPASAAAEQELTRAAYAEVRETSVAAAAPTQSEPEGDEDEDLGDFPIPTGQLDWREELKLRVQRIKKKKEAKLRKLKGADGPRSWPPRTSAATAPKLPLADPDEVESEPERETVPERLPPQPVPREPLRIHHRTLPPPQPLPPSPPIRPAARFQAPRPPAPAPQPEPEFPRQAGGWAYTPVVPPPAASGPEPRDPEPFSRRMESAPPQSPSMLFEPETESRPEPDPTSIPEEMVRAASSMRTAGASKRFWAALYDFVFLFLIDLGIVWGTGQLLGTTVFQVVRSSIWTLAPLLAIVDLGYFLFFTGASGETFGKMIMKLRVISMDGSPCNFKQAAIRTSSYLLSSALAGLGFLWICWDDNDQGWHDKLAHTLVLDRNES